MAKNKKVLKAATSVFNIVALVVSIMAPVLTLAPQTVYAADTGWNSSDFGVSESFTGSDHAWSNPTNARTDNNQYATATIEGSSNTSEYLKVYDFDFSIPDGATINGIEVEIERYMTCAETSCTSNVRDHRVRLVKAGVIGSTDYAKTTTNWGTSVSDAIYGGPTDLWGTTWSVSDINNSNTGVVLSVGRTSGGDRTARVDYIKMKVYYTLANVTLCHSTGSGTYNQITIDYNGTLSGHDGHSNDIIPAGVWDTDGKNWDVEGQAIWGNNCVVPTEVCDGTDNDFDGQTDEGFNVGQTCSVGIGACETTGQNVCTQDHTSVECSATPGQPGTETCDGVLDQDCDGTVDEGCNCTNGAARQCGTTDVGICSYGMQLCINGNWDTGCAGVVFPTQETCGNQIDEDCDGSDLACICGDGIVNQTSEECDDGNSVNDDACTNDCKNVVACIDTDNDKICDDQDNCIDVANAGQEDDDMDGIGNACDIYNCIPTGNEICTDGLDNDCDQSIDEDCTVSGYCGDNDVNSTGEQCDGTDMGQADSPNYFCSVNCELIPIYVGGDECPKGTEPIKLGDTHLIGSTTALPTGIVLPDSGTYLFRASGTFIPTSAQGYISDAGYTTINNVLAPQYGINGTGNDYAAHALLGDLGGGIGVIQWGAYNPINNTYSFVYNVPINDPEFVIGDRYSNWFNTPWQDQSGMNDNSGSLNLEVYECKPTCGNGVCGDGENCENCSQDCGPCSTPGYCGMYFNHIPDGVDFEKLSYIGGVVTGDNPFNHSTWWDVAKLAFVRTDSALAFGNNFLPVDQDLTGDPFHFTAKWQAKLIVSTEGDYGYFLRSDDDSWMYIDGTMRVDLGGVHAPTTRTGSIHLTQGEHTFNLYFAERHTTQSFLDFHWTTPGIEIIADCEDYCGDQICNGRETCDSCQLDCGECPPLPFCGDGIVNNDEQCDDGNQTDGDGCTANCTIEKPACDPEVNLVINGSFEEPIVETSQKWDIFSSVLGWATRWITSDEDGLLELHRGVNGWLPFIGDQYAELDSDSEGPTGSTSGEPASVKIYQDIPTIPGYTYEVKFAFSPRPGTGSNDNQLGLSWDNISRDTIVAAGETSNTAWTEHTYQFVSSSGSATRLQFSDLGDSNSLGTFLDNVSVRCIGPACVSSPEICDDQIDNDCDQATDCADEDCIRATNCYQEPDSYCGDGSTEGEEQCDDGNIVDGDGCSANCTVEQGRCGDGICNNGETCVTCSGDCTGTCSNSGGGGGGSYATFDFPQIAGATTEQQGEVLGASTELPETGGEPLMLIISSLIIAAGAGFGLKKKLVV